MPSRRPIAIDDFAALRIPGDAHVSPDGSLVLFTLRDVSPTRPSEYQRSLWLVGRRGGPPRQFTAGPRDGGGRWSPAGSPLGPCVAFIRAEPKSRPQLWLIPASGGEARKLTDFPEGHIASFKWSPDGASLAVSFRATSATFTEAATKTRRERGESDPPRVLDDIQYRLDGDGYFDEARHVLHLVDATTGRSRVLYDKDTTGDFSYDWSPDGQWIAVTTNTRRRAFFEPWLDELALIHIQDRRVVKLTGPPVGPKSAVAWSPDGRFLAWAGRADTRDGLYSPDNLHLWVARVDRAVTAAGRRGTKQTPLREVRNLSEGEDLCLMAAILSDSADASFNPTVLWSPDSRRVFTRIGRRGVGHIASIAVEGGRFVMHTKEGDRTLGRFSDDGAALSSVAIFADRPPEVAILEGVGKAKASSRPRNQPRLRERILTGFNSAFLKQVALAPMVAHTVVAEDGQRSQVWLLRPPKAGPRKRTPAILMVHGGPHAQYGEVFFHEMQYLAAQGYTVLMGNPRGSKGYGQEFCAAIRGSWGQKDWLDVQASLRFLQEHPGVDRGRIAIAGGSYGGYMTVWAIGHTRDFRCAITDRCVSNMLSMAGNSDYPDTGEYWPGKVWRDWEARWEASPIKHIGNARTPTLIIHSEGDLRCNVEQGEQVFTALCDLGVPTRFIRYPASTSHGMSRTGPPDLRKHRLTAMAEWMGEWMGGR